MKILPFLLFLFLLQPGNAETGYRLWLRYDKIENQQLLNEYRQQIKNLFVDGDSPTLVAAQKELLAGLGGLLGKPILLANNLKSKGLLIFTTFNSNTFKSLKIEVSKLNLGNEGFIIKTISLNNTKVIVVAAPEEIGVLYGAFHFLRLIQTNASINHLSIEQSPKIKLRLLNHWDNLDRTVERGYAGFSIWNWHKLPKYVDKRYEDYARANASIGINGTVLTNVNANALTLTPEYLEKVKALADVFRPYGIKVYLTARFNAPMELNKYETADPLNEKVRQWWKDKVDEIYTYVPDFGGFVVKANSEGQPGPQAC